MPRLVLLELVGNRWPRADERHVSAQHVPELRQLVEAAVSEKASDRRDPWIVGELEDFGLTRLALAARIDEPRDVLLMERLVHVHVHRPELENLERFHPLADAHLFEKYRARRPQLHQRGNEQEQRREQQQERGAPDDIERALGREVNPASGVPPVFIRRRVPWAMMNVQLDGESSEGFGVQH